MKNNKKIVSTKNLEKLLFYNRELLKFKLSYKKKKFFSENFENQKLYRIYKELKKTIARLSLKSLQT